MTRQMHASVFGVYFRDYIFCMIRWVGHCLQVSHLTPSRILLAYAKREHAVSILEIYNLHLL